MKKTVSKQKEKMIKKYGLQELRTHIETRMAEYRLMNY